MTEQLRKTFEEWYAENVDPSEDFERDEANGAYTGVCVNVSLVTYIHQQKEIDRLKRVARDNIKKAYNTGTKDGARGECYGDPYIINKLASPVFHPPHLPVIKRVSDD